MLRRLVHDGIRFCTLCERRPDIDTGLSLTPEAYQLLYEEIMKVVANDWPDETPGRLPYAIPAWDDTAAWAKGGP